MATLEELEDAHLLLHLVDISAPDLEDRIASVEGVIDGLGLSGKRRFIVFNKRDRVDPAVAANVEKRYNAVSISSLRKQGIDRLIAAIETAVGGEHLAAN